MTLEGLKHLLAAAERHVHASHAAVARQRRVISALARDGHDTALGRKLLGTLEQTLAVYEAERRKLRRQVARASLSDARDSTFH